MAGFGDYLTFMELFPIIVAAHIWSKDRVSYKSKIQEFLPLWGIMALQNSWPVLVHHLLQFLLRLKVCQSVPWRFTWLPSCSRQRPSVFLTTPQNSEWDSLNQKGGSASEGRVPSYHPRDPFWPHYSIPAGVQLEAILFKTISLVMF